MLMKDQLGDGGRLPRRCRVESISFSAHCDFMQTSEFIDMVKPQHIVLVHGERNQMARLCDALNRKYKQAELMQERRRQQAASGGSAAAEAGDETGPALLPTWRPLNIWTPENCVSVSIAFPAQQKAHCVGTMAEMVPGIGHPVRGVIVRRDFESTLMHPDELPEFSDLTTMTIESRVAVPMQHTLMPQLIAALVAVWSDVVVRDAAAEAAAGAAGSKAPPQVVVCGRVSIRAAVAVPLGEEKAVPAAAAAEEPADPRKRRKAVTKDPAVVAAEGKGADTSMDSVIISWTAGVIDDMIADSVAALVCQCSISPFAVLQHTQRHHHHHHDSHDGAADTAVKDGPHDQALAIFRFLEAQYGDQRVQREGDLIVVDGVVLVSRNDAKVWTVTSDDEHKPLAVQIDKLVQKLLGNSVIAPINANVL
jgi:hypothetical protein